MNIEIEFLETTAQIEKKMLVALADLINDKLPAVVNKTEVELKNEFLSLFRSSIEYNAIVNGPLNAHFGIPKGEEATRVDAIVSRLISTIKVDFEKVKLAGRKFKGGFIVYGFVSDFSDILNMSESFIDTGKDRLNWLEWLLIEGDRIIISDYVIQFNSRGWGRSNEAIMVEQNGGFWRVPPQFSGTIKDNWITRVVDGSINFLNQWFETTLQRNFN